MLKSYLAILRRYPAVIGFGFLCTFFSNFGQTFFIGLYGEDFQNAWSLSSTEFGMIYSGVTVASAGLLLVLGHFIDKVPLRRYVVIVCTALAAGCFLIAHAVALPLFVLGLWLVRFNGQGIMTHMSSTVTAREVHEGRGQSLSLAVLGLPAGSILFPMLFTAAAALADWRMAWMGYALVYLLVALPLLLRLAPRRPLELPDMLDASAGEGRKLHRVLLDPALWLLLAANMLMPFLLTGIFFHQQRLMEGLGFSAQLYAFSFVAYGIGHAVAELLSGYLVDRFGATRVLRLFLLPFLLATLALLAFPVPVMLPVFMLASALTAGCTHSARGSYLAERYGTRQLGAVKSLFTSGMVLSSSLSPILFGVILDRALGVEAILHLCWMSAALLCAALQALGYMKPGHAEKKG